MIDQDRLDEHVRIIRAGMKREVAQIRDLFTSMYRDAGPTATVLRVKRAPPGWQTVQDIAKQEWETAPRNPRIEWVDTTIN